MSTADRGEQILAEAARLFREKGFHGASMDDIGESVGITAAAIYRYYRNKQQLLAAMVERILVSLAGQIEAAFEHGDATLEQFAALTVRTCISDRDLMAVYAWESRSLPVPLRNRVAKQRDLMATLWRRKLREVRPEISASETRYRIGGANGMALLPLSYESELDSDQLEALLVKLMMSAMNAASLDFDPTPMARTQLSEDGGDARVRRRDTVLDEAVKLFRKYGYPAVSIEAIAAAVGLDQSSVYRHYAGKDEILGAALELVAQRLDEGVREMDSLLLTPQLRLQHLLLNHVNAALANRDLIAVWATEATHLTGPAGRAAQARQRAYLDVWTAALHANLPELDDAKAQVTIRAIFLFITASVSLTSTTSFSEARLRTLLCGVSMDCLSRAVEIQFASGVRRSA